jgi:hypothetical protein
MRKTVIVFIISLVFLSLAFILFKTVMAQSVLGAGNIVVQTIPGPTLAQQIFEHLQTSWPWYLVRGSGIIAALSLIVLILSGLGLFTGYTYRFLEPLTAWASHRALGIVFGVSIILHMGGLLFDHFVSFNLLNMLVPWLSNYRPVTIWGFQLGSLYVALGVLAFYLTALIIITSLVWIEKKPYLWKLTHLMSYVVMLLVFIHALYLGTDLAGGLLRWLWVAVGVCMFGLIVYRLWRSKTI